MRWKTRLRKLYSPQARRTGALVNFWASLVGVPSLGFLWLSGVLNTKQMVGIGLIISLLTHAVSSLDTFLTADVRVQQENGKAH